MYRQQQQQKNDPDSVVHAYNTTTQEAEVGVSQVQWQPGPFSGNL